LPGWSRGRWLLAGAVAALVVGIGVWLGMRDGESEPPPAEEGALVEGLAGSWQRVNPLFAGLNEVDQDIAALVFAGLLRNGPDGSPEPDMADLPTVSNEGRVYTFTLRPGLRWHDGQPVTSADVAFTIAALKDPGFRGPVALAELWADVQVATPDDATIAFTLPQPLASFPARHATIGILPSHLLEGLPAQAMFEAVFNQAPVGTGPYRLASLNAEEAVLTAFEGYHFGAPATPRIEFRFFPDYPAATAALAAGLIDTLMLREPMTAARLAEVTAIEDVKFTAYDRAAYLALYLNNDQALFSQPEVRRAIAIAIDREALVNDQMGTVARASNSIIPPGSWAYDATHDETETRLTAAAGLLDEAGWTVNAATGVRTKDGVELRFTIRTDNDAQRTEIATEVAQQLEALGIRANVASTTFLVLQRDFLRERRYDAAIAGWDQGADPDPYSGWHSSQLGTAALNLANFRDVVMDELIATARLSLDTSVRADLYSQVQARWAEVAPSAVLLYPQYLYAVRGTVAGPEPVLLVRPASRFYNVHLWTR
jgi:peptide/nickel transport system substrate-binding protein